jgi:peptidoglycan/LPS O-acetylase OafA/YrhL
MENEMAQVTLQSAQKSQGKAVAKETTRIFFLDYLRAALVILVVLHHVALVYGAGAPFYYVEPPLTDPLAYLVLLVFILFNQAWFMGALFLIAGYFTPGSYERKGSGSFLKSRMLRLGIPLLIWIFVISPLSSIGYWYIPAEFTGISEPLTWQAYPFLIGLGVAWFLALLLIFSFGYAAWREPTKNETTSVHESQPPSYLGIGLFILALALASYLVRIIIPMGKEMLDFPTLSYLPQYLGFFIAGIIASRRNWMRTLPGSMGVAGFVAAIVASLILFPLAASGTMFSLQFSEPASWVGNGTWQSAVYALWDSLFAVGMTMAAITFFRRFFNEKSKFGAFLSQQSYAVYIIHVPIIVFLAIALGQIIDLAPLPKFAVMSAIIVPTCFVVAYILRKIPGVSKVL